MSKKEEKQLTAPRKLRNYWAFVKSLDLKTVAACFKHLKYCDSWMASVERPFRKAIFKRIPAHLISGRSFQGSLIH